jgi:hypothetical protein
VVKNLISYLYLEDPNDLEKSLGLNLKFIKLYYEIFDGHKIIYISTNDSLDENSKIKISKELGHPIARFVKNNSENRESEYFIDQLKDLRSNMDPESITFYHHSKGSTYQNPNVDKWISSMYYFNLCEESLKDVEDHLSKDKIFAGTFRVDYPSPPWVYSDWHFSGTFFWFSSKLFEIDGWDHMVPTRFSTESYPGSKVRIDRSHNIDNITNSGCDLRYTYYWRDLFPNMIPDHKLENWKYLTSDKVKEEYKIDISEKESAWVGHYDFAIDMVKLLKPKVTVELGVDWGFSMFTFAYSKIGEVYGIDWFQGDPHAGLRDTKEHVLELYKNLKDKYGISTNIIKGDFTDISTIWTKEIDILHIDGFHSYESVKQDFQNWSKFITTSGVVLFHDVEIFDGVSRFFTELDGYKLIKSGSCGLGIWTRDKDIYEKIRTIF